MSLATSGPSATASKNAINRPLAKTISTPNVRLNVPDTHPP
jgi:hypothetical protein